VVTIAGVSYPTEEIRMRRHIQRENGSPFPYHILSFSDEQSTKLRRDFESCGEVLVRDIQLFFDLLCEQLRITQPQATLQLYNVDYYDPFAVDPSSGGTMDILWRKPIQFLYQREVRLVIVNGQPECERISLHIKASDGLFELIN
jgi:hypothetical protein